MIDGSNAYIFAQHVDLLYNSNIALSSSLGKHDHVCFEYAHKMHSLRHLLSTYFFNHYYKSDGMNQYLKMFV
jgi:hypothetical protein